MQNIVSNVAVPADDPEDPTTALSTSWEDAIHGHRVAIYRHCRYALHCLVRLECLAKYLKNVYKSK